MELKEKLPVERIVRKILVKCPPGVENAFSLFPFLITLSEEYPKAEINLITEEKCSLAYNFLPVKMRFFERPKEKLSFFQTHHFCANLNDIFNVDLFFDLENNFNSSFMGFNFRSVERVGYDLGLNKYFLTKLFPPRKDDPIEVSSLKLLELYRERNFQDVRISKVSDEGLLIDPIEQLFKEPEPPKFIMIMLDNFQNVSKQIGMWTKFFDCFQNQKFIIWSQEDEDLISELFKSVDLGHNNLYMHRGINSKEMIYLFKRTKGAVTNNVWAEGLCAYAGVNALSFFTEPVSSLPQYQYFRMKPQRFLFSETSPIKYTYLDETREFEVMNHVVDRIHFIFKL
jgi:ADP-heptose:LPS heptosyltransferase